MKQKVLIGGLCFSLVLSLVGCGRPQEPQDQQEPPEPKQEVQQVETINTEATPPEVRQLSNEEKQPLSGDALIEYFQLVYGLGDGLGNSCTLSEKIDFEITLLGFRAENENQLLPDDYADQYKAWRPVNKVADPFTEVNEQVWATGTVNLRSGPSTNDDKVGSLSKSDSVTRTGIGTGEVEGWSRIQLVDGSIVYVSSDYLTTTKPSTQSNTQQNGGGTQNTTQNTTKNTTTDTTKSQTTSAPSKPASGGKDIYDGYATYDEYIAHIQTKLPNMTIEQLKQSFPDLANPDYNARLAEESAQKGLLGHSSGD